MTGVKTTLENDFYKWLSRQVSPSQLSDLYTAFRVIDDFCLKERILERSLFETTDILSLAMVRNIVEQDRDFRTRIKGNQKMLAQAIRYYITYVKTVVKPKGVDAIQENNNGTTNEETIQYADSLVEILSKKGIAYIDNREKKGCLWVKGGRELKPLMDQLKGFGASFYYKNEGGLATGGEPAWWTVNKIAIPVKQIEYLTVEHQTHMQRKESVQRNKYNHNNKDAFLFWLKQQSYDDKRANFLVSVLEKCGEFAEKKGLINKEIFLFSDRAEFREIRKKIKSNVSFIKWDTKNKGKCLVAIDTYFKYLIDKTDEDIVPTPTVVDTQDNKHLEERHEEKPGEKSQEQYKELDELLKEDLYKPLKDALYSHGITTLEGLKDIKLWAFMNRCNLYSIAVRQSVAQQIRERLQGDTDDTVCRFSMKCDEITYNGISWKELYLSFCEDYSRKYPLRFRSLIGKTIRPNGPVAVYKSSGPGHFAKMYNPTAYISDELTEEELCENVTWICEMCSGSKPEIYCEGTDSDYNTKLANKQDSITVEQLEAVQTKNESTQGLYTQRDAFEKRKIEQTEDIVLEADLAGIPIEKLKEKINLSLAATRHVIKQSKRLFEIKGRIFHEEAFIDWVEGAEQLSDILKKLMQKNNGYISAAQLYDYARVEMSMFLNDNNIDDERSVFEIAQHLFENGVYNGTRYAFSGKSHISDPESAIGSHYDIICKFAKDCGGIFKYSDLVEYLNGMDIKTGNLRTQLRLHSTPDFFYYKEGEIIYAESMSIDDDWKRCVNSALVKLFDDVGDHIILRDIQPIWFEQLPWLPGNNSWTPLLLQSILRFYGDEFNARTICALETQSIETLHAMLVRQDSPIQNFGDVIISYFMENDISKRTFQAEELRLLLADAKMIRGNELINNMPKALSGDERFSWDAGESIVTVLV